MHRCGHCHRATAIVGDLKISSLASFLNHPLQSAVISFTVGTLALLLVIALIRPPMPDLERLNTAPGYLFLGGLFGALMVSSAIILIPRIGVTAFVGGIIVGQLLGATFLDHFGFFGLSPRPINTRSLCGILLLMVGFALTRRG